MGIGNFFHAFQPKDKVFYQLFENVTENLLAMSSDFEKGISEFDKIDDAFLEKMNQYEHKNDELTHEIYVELSKNFITPFDREDIHTLASGLDDIADYIYASTKYIILYKTPHQEAYAEFAKIITEACIEIQKATKNLRGFKNPKEVEAACIRVNSLENMADEVLSSSMVKLFETNDPINVIKISSVLNYLETVTDKAEEVANTIQSITIKYA